MDRKQFFIHETEGNIEFPIELLLKHNHPLKRVGVLLLRISKQRLQRIGRDRRTIAVLGEMRELGDFSAEAHRDVGAAAADLGIDVVMAVGPGAEPIAAAAEAAGVQVVRAADVEEAHRVVMQLLAPSDVILFKSSRDSGLRFLGDRITLEQGGYLQEHGPTHA